MRSGIGDKGWFWSGPIIRPPWVLLAPQRPRKALVRMPSGSRQAWDGASLRCVAAFEWTE